MPCGMGEVVNRTLRFEDTAYTDATSLLNALTALGFDKRNIQVYQDALYAQVDGVYIKFVKTPKGLVLEAEEYDLGLLNRRHKDFVAALGLRYQVSVAQRYAEATGGTVTAVQEGALMKVRVTY